MSAENRLTSIVSYPERGTGGNNRYRGNCSPRLIEDLIGFFKPAEICDYMCGSGTTQDAAHSMGIISHCYDLHSGFDLINCEIPERPEFVFWHPPYWDMITYSDVMYKASEVQSKYGYDPRQFDLSRIPKWEDFVRVMNYAMMKQFCALERGGRMAVLVGDIKKKGQLYSMLFELIKPGTLENVIIKAQHNCFSNQTQYSGHLIPILHEYLLIIKKDPVRSTAYKSLLDRAKISGSALPKLSRQRLASVLNDCLELYSSETLLLIRDEKISAAHSGDSMDYSVLPIDELLKVLTKKLDDRFPGSMFQGGYRNHSLSSASWTMPGQKEDLLGAYAKLLASQGKPTLAAKLVPAIRFVTSDTGIASAKVSAMLEGTQHPIHIGSCIAVDHRHQSKVEDFEAALDQLFAQFGDSVARLQKLLDIHLSYPVNAMTRICKKLSLPKKAALEAIGMFEMAYGGGPATAHDVFMAMQEIPYILKSDHAPESKMLVVEENMARALTLRWGDYDLAKAVSY